ncbi:N-acetylmuramoyl-L-alanine amidase [Streptomyces sp. NPDC053493]|uniref:N-acetylmuramoyl-L-alanine amidase n=1 Tax=Streptomyces sp. NPDC053493 TaxID=3365705 RepID=UPI0037CD61B8
MIHRHRKDRKNRARKRLLYGTLAGVLAGAATVTLAVASPGVLGGGADPENGTADASLQSAFADAAREFDVPPGVLMAVSYRQTRWKSHDGEPSTTGAYNVMGLTKVDPADLERPDDEERLSHLNESGRPEIERTFDRARVLRVLPKRTVDTDDPRLHTLDRAAELTGSSAEALKNDPVQSIRAGAALLAAYQREATGELPDDPGAWYPAVARYSQAPDRKGAELFARRVFESVRTGEREVTADGEQVVLPADPDVRPVRPSRVPLAATFASTAAVPVPECPAGLNCDFVPSRTGANGERNYTVADRPAAGVDVRQIVVHDTEGGYDGSLATLTDPAVKASAHYLVRASDGLVTQMVENKNLAWHAGNWSLNMHAIGVEHEGYAISESSWYTEPQYESTAALVKFLAGKYGVPLDREHVIGHDEVPVQLDGSIGKTHWDPGPFWDWNHFMALMGAPTGDGRAGGPLRAGQVVRVVPPFTSANQPKLTYRNGTAVAPRPANFGYLYAEPSTGAAPLTDPYFSSLWSEGSNWADKVRAGGAYVVAEARTDWTAIWFGGKKAWFLNPGGQYTAPVTTAPVQVRARPGTTVRIYGRAFPETAAYAAAGQTAPTDDPDHLSKYSLPAGQAYAKAGPAVRGDDWFGSAQVNVRGQTLYLPIRYHHRLAWVKASDVEEVAGAAPVSGAGRYDVVARDGSGVLWQYQGTGGAGTPFFTRYRLGGGWNLYDTVSPTTALRADGVGDLVARDGSGTLWYYAASGDPSAPFRTRLRVGTGWNLYDRLLGARDVTGDGRADLVGRDRTGVLWLYKGTGNAGTPFATRTRIGGGWQIYDQLISSGDATGDGRADLLARDPSGTLWLYKGTGAAATPYATRTRVGTGWQGYDRLLGPSDLTGDGRADLVARDRSGVLWLYKGTGNATAPYATRTRIGGGWQTYGLVV